MINKIAKISEVLDALHCGAALLDRQGMVIHANARICAMTGWPQAELEGKNIRDLYLSREARGRIDDSMAHLSEPREIEFYVPRKDGSRVPVIISRREMTGDLCDHYIASMIDISSQKEAEEAVRRQLELVAQLSDTAVEQAVQLKRHSQELEQTVKRRTEELRLANLDAIYMLAVASEAKDEDTGAHVRRIQELAERLAVQIGLPEKEAQQVGYSAVLHDVGKIHVPDNILKKPGPLDAIERKVMEEHTAAGERILAGGNFFSRARRIARSHHENWDGSGYPDALHGESIPMEARIVHVVDVWDALTSVRAYKKAWEPKRAREFVMENAGKMFDREMARGFLAMIGE